MHDPGEGGEEAQDPVRKKGKQSKTEKTKGRSARGKKRGGRSKKCFPMNRPKGEVDVEKKNARNLASRQKNVGSKGKKR